VLDKITGIRAYNKYTVVFDFPMKNYDDWIRQTYLLSLPQTAIYSRKIYEEKQIFSGASRFLLLKSNQESITLVSGNDILLNYQVIPSESGRWFNFKRNKLDIYEADGIFQFMPNQLKGFKKVVKDQATVFYAAIVSEQNSILAIKEIRRALNYKIDRKNLTEKILLKSYIPADYPVPDILGMHLEPVYNYQKDYDCLSLTSGYENEMIDIFTMSDRDRQLMGRVIQNVLSDCKIKSRIKALDLATLIKFNNEKKKGIYLLKWIADYPHAENFLIPLFHSQNAGSGGNRSFYQNKILDNLLDKGVNMDNLSEIQNIIRMDAPWIFIGFSRKTYYVNEEKKIDIPAVYTGWNENAFGL
jgi:ABC-type transport system substrate-binding protein